MTIFVSGDSNSVRRNGWVSALASHPETPGPVKNISIGGAPSHMSLLRAIRETGLGQGDVFLWAYGINDALYVRNANYSVAELTDILRQIIRICADAGAVFAPMIFQPRRHSQIRRKSAYRAALHRLFDESGISYFDVDAAYLAANPEVELLPQTFYEDYLHYAQDEPVHDHIVRGALNLIARADVPSRPEGDLADIRLIDSFAECEQGLLENSAVGRVATWNPGPQGLRVPLTGQGRVVGIFVTTTRHGGVWDVRFGDRSHRISVAFADRYFDRTMLKFISLPAVTGEGFDFDGEGELRVEWADEADGALADFWFLADPEAANVAGREARLVAVMTEDASGRRRITG